MKNIYLFFQFMLVCMLSVIKAQAVGINTNQPDPSSILDIRSTDKGLLTPRIQLVSLTDKTSPILNPVDGLIIYNNSESTLHEGYYIWNNNTWNLVSAFGNSVISSIITNTVSATVFDVTNETVLKGGSFIFSGILGITYNNTTGEINLPAGKYVVSASLNMLTEETTSSAGTIGNTIKSNLHVYEATLTNLANTVQYGKKSLENALSDTSGNKKHSINTSISINLSSPASFVLRLKRDAVNSTYAGKSFINNSFIHIQKTP